MKGFVPTPPDVVDLMVEKLFREGGVTRYSRILDPGCGKGAFIEGLIRWCAKRNVPLPRIVAIDSDPSHVAEAISKFAHVPEIEIKHADFLQRTSERFDFIIGNPPYVPITALSPDERTLYRREYRTAQGRFDLYLLFFEQSLGMLRPGGRLVFVTPEKFTYVETARPLRGLLKDFTVEELHFLNEETFPGLVTYPLISTVVHTDEKTTTRIVARNGVVRSVTLDHHAASWMPTMSGARSDSGESRLADACARISCGVATGADSVFVMESSQIVEGLRAFAHPTISGRQLRWDSEPSGRHSMLIPYRADGSLIPEEELGSLASYLSTDANKTRLLARTCVSRKPWYAFHETPPLQEILRPKVLCKDIGAEPFFVVDAAGTIVPRHSVYYIVPSNPAALHAIAAYLNSSVSLSWLRNNCQRAANGFLRLQSHTLKRLPVPEELVADGIPDVMEVAGQHRSA